MRVLFAVVLLAACRRDLEYGSTSDMRALLRKKGADVAGLTCRNARIDGRVTRGVTCRTKLTAPQHHALTASMGLKPHAPTFLHELDSDTCDKTPGFASGTPGVEVSRGVEPKSGWTYYLLHVVVATGEACFQTEYAWSS